MVLRYRGSIVLTDYPSYLLTVSIVHGSLIPTVSDFMRSMNMCVGITDEDKRKSLSI